MWEKGKSFIIKAGTIIFIACAVIWFLQSFSFSFQYLGGGQIEQSILAGIGKFFSPLFVPLGFGNWPATVATITGLVAKEVVVSTFALIGSETPIVFTQVSAYAFMIFTLLAAPCFAAIGATKREMGGWKWTWIAILYQTGLAYTLAMIVNLIGGIIFPAIPIELTGNIEAASEGAITTVAILENPLIYILGVIIIAVAAIGIVRMFNKSKGRKLAVLT